MTEHPIADHDPRLWKHVDHDVSRLVELHEEINGRRWAAYGETTRRGLNVAYAAAYRSVMEFVHSGRPLHPNKRESVALVQRRRAGRAYPDGGSDITSKGLCGEPLASGWTPEEEARHDDADKLVSRLSKDRVTREGMDRDWGDSADRALWEPYVRDLVARFCDDLPMTCAAYKRAGG